MTNVTGVLHILIGTYELLNFRNLSGQASRRGLDLHFPRYLFQHEQDLDTPHAGTLSPQAVRFVKAGDSCTVHIELTKALSMRHYPRAISF
jgi:hypothetical protein